VLCFDYVCFCVSPLAMKCFCLLFFEVELVMCLFGQGMEERRFTVLNIKEVVLVMCLPVCNYIRILHTDLSVCNYIQILHTDFTYGSKIRIKELPTTVLHTNFCPYVTLFYIRILCVTYEFWLYVI